MEINQQHCANPNCLDVGKINHGNIKIYSHKERRYYCTTCGQTFSASRDTLFYKLRTPRQDFIEAISMLAERNSLRSIARIKHAKLGTVLQWLDRAGHQAAAVSRKLIRNLHLTQVQIDELWTFIKKSRVTSLTTKPQKVWVTIGSGEPSRSLLDCALPVTSARSVAKRRPALLSSIYGPQVMVRHHSLPATNCPPISPL